MDISRRRIFRAGLIGTLFLIQVVRGTSIFDDNWKPPPDSRPPASSPPPPPDIPATPQAPRMGKSKPTPPPPANATQAPVTPIPPPTAGISRPPAQNARRRIPSAAVQADTEKSVKSVFLTEYANKTPAGQVALARALLSEAHNSADDAASLYVLLSQARDVASAGGDPSIAVEAARDLRDAFMIDARTAKDAEMAALSSSIRAMPVGQGTAASTAHRGAELAIELAEYDLAQGDYAGALAAAELADIAATKTRDWEFPNRVKARYYQILDLQREYEQDKLALATLKTNPKDPAANLAAGRFYAFYLDDWTRALPMLIAGADPAMKDAPARDLKAAKSNHPEDLLIAGDGWTEVARPQPMGTVRDAMQRRAMSLYKSAAIATSGPTKAAAQKKASDLRASRLIRGLTGEYFRGEFAKRVFVRADPSIAFNWGGMQPEPLISSEAFTVRWTGMIKAAPGEYDLHSVHDDGMRIYIDGRTVLDHWVKTGRESVKCAFTGGLQEIRVEYIQRLGGSYAGLGWKLPRSKVVKAIPDSAFLHEPLTPGPVYAALCKPDEAGKIMLVPADAAMHGPSLHLVEKENDHVLGGWTEPSAWVSWDFESADGDYDVEMAYSCGEGDGGGHYRMTVANGQWTGAVEDTQNWTNYTRTRVGRVHLSRGLETLRISVVDKPRKVFMDVKSVVLTPATASR